MVDAISPENSLELNSHKADRSHSKNHPNYKIYDDIQSDYCYKIELLVFYLQINYESMHVDCALEKLRAKTLRK